MTRSILFTNQVEVLEGKWPLKPSANGRYITYGNGTPVFILCDSAQSVLYSINETDFTTFCANREAKKFTGCWVHVYGDFSPSVNGNAFLSGSDVSRPNPSYFAHLDRCLDIARDHNQVMWLGISGHDSSVDDPFVANGTTKLFNYGAFLGDRWKDKGNIVWVIGGDWSSYKDDTINNAMLALMNGVKSADTGNHPMTLEIYPTPILSSDGFGRGWRDYVTINAAYTYAASYTLAKKAWNVSPHIPCIPIEYLYEYEPGTNNERHGYRGTPWTLRKNAHWSILYGIIGGYFYGNEATWAFIHADLPLLDSPGSQQATNLQTLYGTRRWHDLIPDHAHVIGTAGLGSFPLTGEWNVNMNAVTATTVAATADGALCIAYMERRRDLTINMNNLASGLHAKWFNPETAEYTDAGGPFTGSHVFSPPTRTGDNDWVLILE